MTIQQTDDAFLYTVCKALGNPVRIQIVRFVQRNPGCIANEIQLHLPNTMVRAQSTLSQHLKILRAAGILESDSEHQGGSYYVNQECLGRVVTMLTALL